MADEREMTWAEMAEKYPTRYDVEGVTREDLMVPVEPNAIYAMNMRLTPYRGCCESIVGTQHLAGCMSHYFVDGQRVVKPSIAGLAYPWDRAPLRVCEDAGSSDRTFENETRLH